MAAKTVPAMVASPTRAPRSLREVVQTPGSGSGAWTWVTASCTLRAAGLPGADLDRVALTADDEVHCLGRGLLRRDDLAGRRDRADFGDELDEVVADLVDHAPRA
jgi:hypothetical protein